MVEMEITKTSFFLQNKNIFFLSFWRAEATFPYQMREQKLTVISTDKNTGELWGMDSGDKSGLYGLSSWCYMECSIHYGIVTK